MNAKELFEELRQKAEDVHRYFEKHPEEANTVPSWMFTTFAVKEGELLLQGCSNVRHEAELAKQIIKKLGKTNFDASLLVLMEMVQIMKSIQQEEVWETPQWIQ
jgi:hypothetical protein